MRSEAILLRSSSTPALYSSTSLPLPSGLHLSPPPATRSARGSPRCASPPSSARSPTRAEEVGHDRCCVPPSSP
eukprot:2769492-Prymnesium_polylepis.1